MKLQDLKPKADAIVAPFTFPKDAVDGMTVHLEYLGPERLGQIAKQEKVRRGNDPKAKDDAAPDDPRSSVNAVLIRAIRKVEGATPRKLRGLVRMDPDAVAAAGGLDSPVNMDPTTSSPDEARGNLIWLLSESLEFSQWVETMSQNLAGYQDDDWESRVKNSSRGRDSNTG